MFPESIFYSIHSAVVNFIKFHVHMAKEGQEQEEAIVRQLATVDAEE